MEKAVVSLALMGITSFTTFAFADDGLGFFFYEDQQTTEKKSHQKHREPPPPQSDLTTQMEYFMEVQKERMRQLYERYGDHRTPEQVRKDVESAVNLGTVR